MSSHTEAGFNKFTGKGQGILVGNWNEERSLREFTGVGRTIVREHIPKRCGNFEVPIESKKTFDSTSERIYGKKLQAPVLDTESQSIGSGYNPADALPKQGRKTLNSDQEIWAKVQEDMREKQRIIDQAQEQRFFDTTSKFDYVPKDLQMNTVGRKTMQNQDRTNVSINKKDEQLVVEHGTWRRLQKTTDNDLQRRIPKGDYTQQQPVTIWTHQQDRKNYYMSAAVGSNPFARTSGLTQPADQTKAVSGFYGNIDFDQESSRVDFRKTQGIDLNQRNPYVERTQTFSSFIDIQRRVLDMAERRGGMQGLEGFLRTHLDKSGDGQVNPEELRFGFKAYGIDLTQDELNSMMKQFDQGRTGRICLNTLVNALTSKKE